jgi:hypothetical protein
MMRTIVRKARISSQESTPTTPEKAQIHPLDREKSLCSLFTDSHGLGWIVRIHSAFALHLSAHRGFRGFVVRLLIAVAARFGPPGAWQ